MAGNLTDVKSWPNVFFGFVLTVLMGGIFLMGTSLINKLDKAVETLISVGAKLELTIKDSAYLRNDVTRLENRVQVLESISREQEKENERLKARIAQYHDK